MAKYISHSPEETAKIAGEWLVRAAAQRSASTGVSSGATVVGLAGHLGAGKTAFAKCVAQTLGITEDVTSPTFVIMKVYPIDSSKGFSWERLVHIDAYRLEHAKELGAIDFEAYAADRGNLVLIEWPENVKEMVEGLDGYSQLNFKVGEKDTERVIEFQ
ncbi:MAG: tRNA (adenosine(37)-N6)-threonylcarbamoyltransferase complex ATPase subunit type 1 TsaE [Patescibacteria group bacterium]